MRHSGVCMLRQYSAFAGIVHGQKTRKFFEKLVRLKYVTTYDCAHNRARIYHVQHKALYRAIGEPESYLRRPPALARAVERLMLLDTVIESPELVWLAGVEEKATHITALTATVAGAAAARDRRRRRRAGERAGSRTDCRSASILRVAPCSCTS